MSPKVNPSRSLLESLPVEIVQKIFLHSLEINLPRASITISRFLSSPIIYTWIIRVAFCSDNAGSRSGIFTRDYLPDEIDFFALTTDQRRDLQNAVLECKWCTLPLMRKCQQDYVAHVIRRKCNNLIFSPDDQNTLSNISNIFTTALDQSRGSLDCVSESYITDREGDIFIPAKIPVREKTGEGEEERLKEHEMDLVLWLYLGGVEIRKSRQHPVPFDEADIFIFPSLSATLPVRIPDKLCNPPFTESKREFLRLLSPPSICEEFVCCAFTLSLSLP